MSISRLAEKFDCGPINDDPDYHRLHPNEKKSWDAEEVEGFDRVTIVIHASDPRKRRREETRIWSAVSKEEKQHNEFLIIQMYEMLDLIRERCDFILKNATDTQLLSCIRSYQNDAKKTKGFVENPDVQVTPTFIRDGLRLFLATNHSIQQLDPGNADFQAVNKPKGLIRDSNTWFQGLDQRLRAYHRHIVIRLPGPNDNYTKCVFIHELAHTPPNHVCFRPDDHKDDFRIFQWFFFNMVERGGFITSRVYV